MALNLNSLDTVALADTGSVLEVEHPITGEKTDMTITLAGMDSKVWRRAVAYAANRRIGRKNKDRVYEQVNADNTLVMARCTLAWSGVELDGQVLPCTEDNAVLLYERFPWLKEQVSAFIEDRQNYLRD